MITPVNGHLLIEPVKHESFMASQKETYEEVGVVIDFDKSINPPIYTYTTAEGIKVLEDKTSIERGDKVYFDSWLAAKFPKSETEHFWLVKWEDVRAVEKYEEVSE